MLLQVVAVFYVLLVRTTLAAAREELLHTRAFVRMIPSRILSREASYSPPPPTPHLCPATTANWKPVGHMHTAPPPRSPLFAELSAVNPA